MQRGSVVPAELQRAAIRLAEHDPVLMPIRAGTEPFFELGSPVRSERFEELHRQGHRPPGRGGFRFHQDESSPGQPLQRAPHRERADREVDVVP